MACASLCSQASNQIGSQKSVSGYYVKGVHFGTDRAENVVGPAVNLATKGLSLVAANADRIGRATNLNTLARLNRVAMPAADLLMKFAERIEEGSSELVKRVSGEALLAKALATGTAVATRKRLTKAAARKAGMIVAETANETSNAARRVARQARNAGMRVASAVANTAIETSNAARRVARRAEATTNAV